MAVVPIRFFPLNRTGIAPDSLAGKLQAGVSDGDLSGYQCRNLHRIQIVTFPIGDPEGFGVEGRSSAA